MRRSFDHLARCYHVLERIFFGSRLQRARTVHLSHLKSAARVLVLGEGDGRFVEQLLRHNPACSVDVLDSSPQMIARARRRIGNDPRVRFCCCDALRYDFRTTIRYDGIVTLFFLDCFEDTDLSALLERLTDTAQARATWLYADFRLDSKSRWRLPQRLGVWLLYRCFSALTDIRASRLSDPLPTLSLLGWSVRDEQHLAAGWIESCVLERKTSASF